MPRSRFVYITYIRTTPERLWSALTTDTEFMKQYWFGTYCESAWQKGSAWQMVWPDGTVADTGEILESDPPRRLVIRWEPQARAEIRGEGASVCTIELEPLGASVKLSITHSIDHEPSKFIDAVSG